MSVLKEELLKQCVAYVQKIIASAEQAINASQEASQEETKSSAGDKYETGRAMIQQDLDRNRTQLNEANKLIVALSRINIGNSSSAETGSLVITANGKFFISISAGILTVNNDSYFAVSPGSPIGMMLRGKKNGEAFTLNGKQYLIESVV